MAAAVFSVLGRARTDADRRRRDLCSGDAAGLGRAQTDHRQVWGDVCVCVCWGGGKGAAGDGRDTHIVTSRKRVDSDEKAIQN